MSAEISDLVRTVEIDLEDARKNAAMWAARAQNLTQALQGLRGAYPDLKTESVTSRNGRLAVQALLNSLSERKGDYPRGQDAVVQVMRDNPDTMYDAPMMLAELRARGWVPEGTDPEGATRQALKRAASTPNGPVRRVRKDGRSFMYGLRTPGVFYVDDVEGEDDDGGDLFP